MGHLRTLVIRADADSRMGAGHVMRCLALAQAWAGEGGTALFCGRVESASLRERLADEGFGLAEPGPRPGDTVSLLTRRGLAGCWVALDGYHFGPERQEELEAAGFRVLCVDDGALLSRYAARVVLAPDHDASPAAYAAPSSSLILAGPRYRLLRRGFAGLPRPARRAGEGAVVLVAFGGADARNATRAAVLGLDRALGPQDTALVVLGPMNRRRESVQQALDGVGYRHELRQDVADMAGIYARCHLAVSAAGGAAWEMAAAGLPALLAPVAANQEPGSAFLARAGCAEVLPGAGDLEKEVFAARVRRLLDDPARLEALSRSGPQACDGRGPQRVCRVLAALDRDQFAQFVLRRAEAGDLEQVFRLANDPAVRANSFSPEPIALEGHARWFTAKLASPDTAFFVLDLEGVVAALARFDRTGDAAEIDVAVHPAFRGRGLGARILREASPLAAAGLGAARLRGVVLEGNVESRRCFSRAGFREAAPEQVRGRTCAVFVLESGAGEA
ncbi:MAG: GNAT family N-acetyltransferase [Thermodesulfobacteriota bacterium]